MIPLPSFFEQPWFANAAKRSRLRRSPVAPPVAPSFDNFATVYAAADAHGRAKLRAKMSTAPRALRKHIDPIIASIDSR